ncbi:LPXTG cell wall anchor domain-containing protein [Streptococcus anginosus]|uniref:Agglutinin receptor n=1 Tax=Streptococcus anginosus SK1138 TaxID=1161422 RepID=A0AAD2T7K7_STRAP|nr:SspB-related isopeptide-forming adhesin [Streptococcus anginosus]EJP25086.1 putative agglutinin receptor [Streptococcus anginosus SK1138]RIB36602.1 LPXTG cell wall anchor domain-containing protein [Streptococcus anginosus]
MKSNETKTYGSIRKIKAYGACGVILGLAALAVATAQISYADEATTTPNTATNLPASQPAQTQAAKQTIAQANQAQGTVNVTVDNSQVNQAVQQAQNAGVKVVQDATVDKGTTNTLAETQKAQADIAQDQAKQKAAVEQTTADYQKAKADHAKAVEETKQKNAQIEAENKALKEAHDKASQQAAQTNQAVDQAKAKIKAEFPDAKVTETTKEVKVDANKTSYNAYTKVVEQVKAENDKATATYQAEKAKENKDIAAAKAYNETVRKQNSANKAKVDAENKEIDKFNKEVAEHNQAEDARVAKEKAQAEADKHKDGYLSQASVQNLIYNSEPNATFEVLTPNSGYQALSSDDKRYEPQEKIAQGKFVGTVNLKQGKSIQVKYSNLQNSSYNGKKISSVVLTYTNKTKDPSPKADLGMAFFKDPTKTFWLFTTTNSDTIPTEVGIDLEFFDDKGQKISLTKDEALIGLASLNNDTIVNGANAKRSSVEQVRVDNGEVIEITGSSVKAHGNVAYSDTDNHFKSAGSKFEQDDWDTGTSKNRYYGSAVAKFKNVDKISLTSISYKRPTVWLAINSEIAVPKVPTAPRYKEAKPHKTFTPEKLKEVPTPKAKLTLVKVNGVPTPTYKPKEKEPKAPTVPTVHVHDYKLSTRPQIAKAVENADKVNVNGQYVAKNSLNRFALQTESLPANRTAYTKLVFNDYLPSGFKLDVEKTGEANKGYEVSYNEKTNFLNFTAKKEILDAVNKNRAKEYQLGALSVWGRPQNDAADYENVFEMVVNEGHSKGGYTRKSNKVLIHTPGKQQPNKPNDPKNPNRDPLKPEKHNYNAAGKLVDGKEMLPEGINYYVSKWTNRPNKSDKSGKEAIAKGFAYIEDYQDDAVTPLESRFQVKDAQGKAVNGLKMYHVLDCKTLSKALNDMIDRSGISPKGAFYMWVAEKPEEFYKAYVQTGMDLYFHTPMQNKKGFTGKYTNQTFQVQFGNGYYSNVVVNHVPELKVQKRVYNNLGDGQNLDGKLIKLGDKFYYYLDGATLPSDRGEALKEYRFYDDFDEKGDEFTGEYKAIAGVDIKLKDGSVIKAGTDLSQYAELKYDKAKGIAEISMKQDFLDKIDNASEFDVDAAIQMKRIAAGTFENTYKNVVNGHEIVSNTVKTTTPEPEKPQPKTPAPTAQKPALPQTGTASGIGLSVLGMILAGFGLFGLKKHKEN